MRRLAFFLLVTSIVVAPSSRLILACGSQCRTEWSAGPKTGVAPLRVAVDGTSGAVNGNMMIDMGGEGIAGHQEWYDGAPCWGIHFYGEHEFYCPGTYTITVWERDYPDYTETVDINVLPPRGYYLFVFAGDTDHDVYVATHVSSSERPFSYSTVDWGDGTSETFAYTRRGLYAGSPNHSYAANGEYTATVKHHYEGQYCSWDQTETILVKIPVVSLAANPSTWGYVKSMYR